MLLSVYIFQINHRANTTPRTPLKRLLPFDDESEDEGESVPTEEAQAVMEIPPTATEDSPTLTTSESGMSPFLNAKFFYFPA